MTQLFAKPPTEVMSRKGPLSGRGQWPPAGPAPFPGIAVICMTRLASEKAWMNAPELEGRAALLSPGITSSHEAGSTIGSGSPAAPGSGFEELP